MSKSGLFAHFGSKEELQLATIDAAEDVFRSEVLEPVLAAPEGLPRLRALCERFLGHVEQGVFPGGCFFASAAAELDTRPGPLRDRIAEVYDGWLALLEGSACGPRSSASSTGPSTRSSSSSRSTPCSPRQRRSSCCAGTRGSSGWRAGPSRRGWVATEHPPDGAVEARGGSSRRPRHRCG